MNLLPPSIVRERIFRKKQGTLVASLILLTAVIGVWAWFASAEAANQARLRDQLDGQVAELTQWNNQIQSVRNAMRDVELELDAYKRVAEARTAWLERVAEIRSHLPEGVWITQLRPDTAQPDRKMVLICSFFKDLVYEDVNLPDNAPIRKFLEDLQASPLFTSETQFLLNVTDLLPAGERGIGRSVATFQIEIVLDDEARKL